MNTSGENIEVVAVFSLAPESTVQYSGIETQLCVKEDYTSVDLEPAVFDSYLCHPV